MDWKLIIISKKFEIDESRTKHMFIIFVDKISNFIS